MTLRDIVADSIYGSVGTISDAQSVWSTLSYIDYNTKFLDNFADIVFSLNGEKEFINEFSNSVKSILKNSNIHIIVTENLGHTFGTILSDAAIFDYVSNTRYKYVWKFSNDVVVNNSIFDLETDPSIEFYYINNIGYNIFNQYGKDEIVDILCNMDFFYPQTNYYIIKKDIKFYPDIETLYNLHKQYNEIRKINPNIQPWHAIEGCDCEHMLRKTIINNQLKKQHMLNKQSTQKIIDFIFNNQIHDGSHKNIMYTDVGNLCHLQYPNHPVVKI